MPKSIDKDDTISEKGQNSSTKLVPFLKRVKIPQQKMVPLGGGGGGGGGKANFGKHFFWQTQKHRVLFAKVCQKIYDFLNA